MGIPSINQKFSNLKQYNRLEEFEMTYEISQRHGLDEHKAFVKFLYMDSELRMK